MTRRCSLVPVLCFLLFAFAVPAHAYTINGAITSDLNTGVYGQPVPIGSPFSASISEFLTGSEYAVSIGGGAVSFGCGATFYTPTDELAVFLSGGTVSYLPNGAADCSYLWTLDSINISLGSFSVFGWIRNPDPHLADLPFALFGVAPVPEPSSFYLLGLRLSLGLTLFLPASLRKPLLNPGLRESNTTRCDDARTQLAFSDLDAD
jgi:hypothetical protein